MPSFVKYALLGPDISVKANLSHLQSAPASIAIPGFRCSRQIKQIHLDSSRLDSPCNSHCPARERSQVPWQLPGARSALSAEPLLLRLLMQPLFRVLRVLFVLTTSYLESAEVFDYFHISNPSKHLLPPPTRQLDSWVRYSNTGCICFHGYLFNIFRLSEGPHNRSMALPQFITRCRQALRNEALWMIISKTITLLRLDRFTLEVETWRRIFSSIIGLDSWVSRKSLVAGGVSRLNLAFDWQHGHVTSPSQVLI